jgi:hypothetical protein
MNPQAYLSACADAIRKKAVSFGREQETGNRKQREPSAKKQSSGKKFRVSSFWFRASGFEEENCWPAVVNSLQIRFAFSGFISFNYALMRP